MLVDENDVTINRLRLSRNLFKNYVSGSNYLIFDEVAKPRRVCSSYSYPCKSSLPINYLQPFHL